MSPEDLAQVRQIAQQAAAAAVAAAPRGGYIPPIWTGEVQLYNACLAQQGVRTLRGLANIVCDLQSGGTGGVGPPCAPDREFIFEDGQITQIRHNTEIGTVRTTDISRDENGRVETILDTWDQDGTLYGRRVDLTYSASGQIATAFCTTPAPYVPPVPPGGGG